MLYLQDTVTFATGCRFFLFNKFTRNGASNSYSLGLKNCYLYILMRKVG